MQTTVVNIYKENYDVYIGRKGKGQSGEFGNPYNRYGREESLKLFRKYFYDRIKNDRQFAAHVHKLRGKILGCFCHPKPCHGHIIADYLNNLPEIKLLKLAVVGPQNFADYKFMKEVLSWHDIRQIISGGEKGADALSRKYAAEHGLDYLEFPANWNKFGKSAGFKRNIQIVNAADEVAAFHDGKSPRTQHTIDIAEEQGKPVYIYKFEHKKINLDDDDITNWG